MLVLKKINFLLDCSGAIEAVAWCNVTLLKRREMSRKKKKDKNA